MSGAAPAGGARVRVAFVHTSPAALAPVAAFYREAAPELDPVNLLDDGLLRLLAEGRHAQVEAQLGALIAGARAAHDARAVLMTCSSVTAPTLAALRARAGVPIIKIDEGMARAAVAAGGTLGVIATFAPTLAPTRALLEGAATAAGHTVTLVEQVADGAYDALLAGDAATHDRLVVACAEALVRRGADAVVLAQVSTARALPAIEARVGAPVLSSLRASLSDLRAAIAAAQNTDA